MAYPQLELLGRRRPLVLGSRSPRRFALLKETGVPFSRIIPEIEESPLPGEEPFPYALRLAEEKAHAIMPALSDGQVVITCDTIVVLGDRVLEKPGDEDDAFDILTELGGKQHVVCTAVTLAESDRILASGHDMTRVFFNEIAPDKIRAYIATGEPMDKAGAYGIQGMGAFLVDRIEGNLDTVIGLPRNLLEELAGEANHLLR